MALPIALPIAAAHCASRGASRTPITRSPTLLTRSARQMVAARALGDSTNKTSRGTLRREDEPEEYWSSESERSGKSPLQDPLALIGLLAIFFPFFFLAIAISFGWVDLSAGRM